MHPYIKAYVLVQYAKRLAAGKRVSQQTKSILIDWIERKQTFIRCLTAPGNSE